MTAPSGSRSAAVSTPNIAVSPDGKKLAFTVRDENTRLWSLPFDPIAGRVLAKGEPITPKGANALYPDVPPERHGTSSTARFAAASTSCAGARSSPATIALLPVNGRDARASMVRRRRRCSRSAGCCPSLRPARPVMRRDRARGSRRQQRTESDGAATAGSSRRMTGPPTENGFSASCEQGPSDSNRVSACCLLRRRRKPKNI